MNKQTKNPLNEIQKANEEFYFRKRDAELSAKQKDLKKMQELGISDTHLREQLMNSGFTEDSVRALFILPLIETAWADNEIHPDEREEILKTLHKRGIGSDTSAFKLISLWLSKPPEDEMFKKAKALLGPLIDDLKQTGTGNIMWILEGTRRVANATGGFLSRIGIGGNTSREEEKIIEQIAKRICEKNQV